MELSNISRLRRKHAKETIRQNSNEDKLKFDIDWFMIDWDKRNKDIAAEVGCCESLVSQKRKRYKPETIKKRNFVRI